MLSLLFLLRLIWNGVGEIIAPRFCCHCGALGSWLCRACARHVRFYDEAITPEISPCFMDLILAASHYEPPLIQLIHVMKYQHGRPVAEWCGQFLYLTLWKQHPELFPHIDVVTAVPLHRHRQTDRGFNQAEVIACTFAQQARLPYFPFLERTRATSAQAATKTKTERLTNLQNAFAPALPLTPELTNKLHGKTVLIIDDVLTTGTTLSLCAEQLKKMGFQTVVGVAVTHRK